MPTLNFPINPTVGQTYDFGQYRYRWDGQKWSTIGNGFNQGAILTTQMREALRRSYAEAGYNLVEGSFETGGIFTNENDVLLHGKTGKAYSGPAGTVAAGTNPTSGGFVDVSSLLPGAGVVRQGRFAMRDYVSVIDFGAVGDWNGTQDVSGAGTDNTDAIQAAINYCVDHGCELHFPHGRYRTTRPLVIDRTINTADPINGGMFGISLRGGGPASSQIVSDHNGACIDYRGGAGAGWHSYFYIDGVGLLKANYGKNAGSIGLKIDDAAFFQVQRFDIYGFEYGMDATDTLSSEFMDGTIRGNEYGFRFAKGTRSHPNNITFRGVKTLNNRTYGGALYRPGLFSYFGGSIESNGYTGILADPAGWGLYVESAGTEAAVGINMSGVYIENNNGKADVWIVQTLNQVIHNFNGCSFLRFLDTRYVTNCILFDSTNESKIALGGCGFKDYSPYVSDNSRLFVAAGNAKIIDNGGNLFLDSIGGNIGIARAVFAPVGINHQLPFASLPDPLKNRNGFIYCPDGGGSARPSLAVSDGVKWWQIVLGQFAGAINSAGSAQIIPRGWTCSRTGTGVYVITHNLNVTSTNYVVVASAKGGQGRGYCSGMVTSSNTFEIYFANPSGSPADMDFCFTLNVI